ncbi:MAG: segregation and condensation protein A [Propionibacteriaceae bacterium]
MRTNSLPTPDLEQGSTGSFEVHLDIFQGPFDLLLHLISKHKLDITEVSLSAVTDEFIAHVKELGSRADLDTTTAFLVVAATLLDLKTARLLPQGEIDDSEDLALLEARDLLFARLLQYRAFKMIAAWLAQNLEAEGRRFPRPGGLEPQFASLLPEVELRVTGAELAQLCVRAMQPKAVAEVSIEHIHTPTVSVREQAQLVLERVKRSQALTFRQLSADADKITTVVRFLALLELFREKLVAFEQRTPLGELTIRWTGGEADDVDIHDEFDGASPDSDATSDPTQVEE